MKIGWGKTATVTVALIGVVSGIIIRSLLSSSSFHDQKLPIKYTVYIAEESAVHTYKAHDINKIDNSNAVITLPTGTIITITDADVIDVIPVE